MGENRKPGRPRVPGIVRCQVRLTADHKRILSYLAVADGVSESQVLRNLLDKEVERIHLTMESLRAAG